MSKITAEHLARRAHVYVRQSTADQVLHNTESKRRQYGLVERAHQLGFGDVVVIDDDLGRSGGGVHRPGFERLLAALCEGQVGAVFCIEASRLARNGRDWHTLLEFCRLVDALIIDEEGIYNPRQSNDRLLLGMKGTLSEMELATLRQRSYEALMQKARRGELLTTLPIGYLRAPRDRIEMDPNRRIREAIALVFRKFRETGSIRQVLLCLRQERIEVPAVIYGTEGRSVVWDLPVYNSVHNILTNPIYGGAYAYGRTKSVVHLAGGRKHVVRGRRVDQNEWTVLLPNHHEGYIAWAEYQTNQQQIMHNAAMKGVLVRGPARSGGALLAGILRCGHCGRRLHVAYSGLGGKCLRYACRGGAINHGVGKCISFGGIKADRIVTEELLARLQPLGMKAALDALDQRAQQTDERLAQKQLALEQACYEVARARRQYDAVDPEHRLVACELERRWNEALREQRDLEAEVETLRTAVPERLAPGTRQRLLEMGDDLRALWQHPQSDQGLKKRLLRTVVREIVATVESGKVFMKVHWHGGDHTAIDFMRSKTGEHRWVSPPDLIALVRALARVQPDAGIASILNRLGRRTARGHTWTEARVRSTRADHEIAAYREGERCARGELTLQETAAELQISTESVRRLIGSKQLPAAQACAGAPWIILRTDVDRFRSVRASDASPRTENENQMALGLQ
jgi:DNA invertase Pin-like site-specific DNA recombinase